MQDDNTNYKHEKEANTTESDKMNKNNKSGYSVQDGGNEETNKSDTYFRGTGKDEINDMKENLNND
ncbi:hypothetical protein [Plasmodium yoelii yoelii]|nr:hypothetical protein [Plasmodium yoelii yoelii]